MIDGGYTLKPYELCFRRICDYAETLGCKVDYWHHAAHIFYGGKYICRIWYRDDDIVEQYGSILEREAYDVDLADQYIPYTKWEKVCYHIKRFFGKAEKNEVLIHKRCPYAVTRRLIPDHYGWDKETMDSYLNKGTGDYYLSEEKLKNLIKFYVTENTVNEKLYLNGLRIKQINEDF
jgi:hypothetical protein